MILNAYAVLDAFLCLLRLSLGLLVCWFGLLAWWGWYNRAPGADSRRALEDRSYLLFLLAHLLLWLNVVSWPVLYLLLQSYVPEWPGVMCIYGVTQIGTGSLGPSRFLPTLLTTLQVLKPAVVFLSGAWFVLYLVSRATLTAPLTGRVLLLLLASATLAVGDAATELAYLAIPKKEEFAAAGCCTAAFDEKSHIGRFLPGDLDEERAGPALYAAYFGVNLGLVVALAGAVWLCRHCFHRAWLFPIVVGTLVAVAVNAVFLIEELAPRLLGLPFHHCPYDLIPQAPESLVALALFCGGSFAVGWAAVVAWLGNVPETRRQVPGTVSRLLRGAIYFYLGSLIMVSVELVLS